MKKGMLGAVVCVSLLVLVGCATPIPQGGLFTDVHLPVAASSHVGQSTKQGTAECTSILGLVATGDASIETAKKNGGITKIHHVDWYANNILGIIGTYTVTVYGE